MKRVICFLIVLVVSIQMNAQELSVIKLKSPDKNRGNSVMKTLSDRSSVREFSNQMLNDQDLSDLLWAANGINRPDGKRTAPSALNKQEVDVYVIMQQGAYLYNPKEHALTPIAKGDFRGAVAGGQDFVKTVPVCLVYVSNLSKLGDPKDQQTLLMGAADVGIVSQNVNIVCSGLGLATVPRAYMDKDALKKALKLTDAQLPIMNNPVGYHKK